MLEDHHAQRSKALVGGEHRRGGLLRNRPSGKLQCTSKSCGGRPGEDRARYQEATREEGVESTAIAGQVGSTVVYAGAQVAVLCSVAL